LAHIDLENIMTAPIIRLKSRHTDTCHRCGGSHYLGGNSELCVILCMECQDDFNAWSDEMDASGVKYLYADFLKETAK
jgi:hypothetical protein